MVEFYIALGATVLALVICALLYLHLGLNRGLSLPRQYQFDWWLARLLPSMESEARLEISQARLLAYEAGVAAANALDVQEIFTWLADETEEFANRVAVPDALLKLGSIEARVTFQFAYGQTLGRRLGTKVWPLWQPGESQLVLRVKPLTATL